MGVPQALSSAQLRELNGLLEGEIEADGLTRRVYAQDASPYQIRPLAVAFPKHAEDCQALVRWCSYAGIPLTPRAAGTSLAGQAIGNGIVVEFTRHMNRVLHIDPTQGIARVQPGVVIADLNAAAAPYGLHFGPDPSTASRATIGGSVGNNSWGMHVLRDGDTRDNLVGLRCVIGDGTLMDIGPLAADALNNLRRQDTVEGRLYEAVCSRLDAERTHLLDAYPRGVPNNHGYALNRLVEMQPWNADGEPFNLAALLCGSEGTLALSTEITVRLMRPAAYHRILLGHFGELGSALTAVPRLLQEAPDALELIDGKILDLAQERGGAILSRAGVEGRPQALLMLDFEGDNEYALDGRLITLQKELAQERIGLSWPILKDATRDAILTIRRSGLGLLMGMDGPAKPVTGLEDGAVPVDNLVSYAAQMHQALMEESLDGIFYGSVGRGLIHMRPILDLSSKQGRETYTRLMEQFAQFNTDLGGSFSGKHGDGRLRARLAQQRLGERVMAVMRDIKRAFDPAGILNPDAIFSAEPALHDFRYQPVKVPLPIRISDRDPHLLAAVARCNGAGVCLEPVERSTMCPSYQATRSEVHGTRGRANLLRQVLSGPRPQESLLTDEVAQALSLCVSCKACKTRCPAGVDMAAVKAEVLHLRNQKLGLSRRARTLARLPELCEQMIRWPKLTNALLATPFAKTALGVSFSRALPRISPQRFSEWMQAHASSAPARTSSQRVALWLDPWTEYFEPALGKAAVEVFEWMGLGVTVTSCLPSGRVELSQGLLDAARARLKRLLRALAPYEDTDTAVVCLEPSDALILRDEALTLLDGEDLELARALATRVQLFDEFIADPAQDEACSQLRFVSKPRKFLVHTHCHQKALAGSGPSLYALRMIPDADVELVQSGCCGMAGFFGYEHEHHETSQRIAELALFPALREQREALVVAAGLSCRTQIMHGLKRGAMHPARALRMALDG